MHLVSLSKEEVAWRDAIDSAFSIDERIPVVGNEPVTALKVIVNNLHSNLGRIDISLGDDELIEDHVVPRENSINLGEINLKAGELILSVKWVTPEAFSFVEVACVLSQKKQTLIVDAWDPMYPPRVLLDDLWLNRPLGQQYTQTGEVVDAKTPETDVLIFHNDFGNAESSALKKLHDRTQITEIEECLGVCLDVWIDGKRPCLPNPDRMHHFGRVYDAQSLTPGLHHVRVADRLRHRILVDTHIVCNGFDWIGIEITDDSGEDLTVDIRKGADRLYSAPISSLMFSEGLTVSNDLFSKLKVDGHDLPPGLGNWLDELKEKREVAKKIRANYKKFLNLRASIRRKAVSGEALTAEEQSAAEVKNPRELHDWVIKRKKAEGLDLRIGGSTGLDGKVTVKKKKGPKTTFEEFSEYHTEFVHEASHVRQIEALWKKYGVDVKKFKRWVELEYRYAANEELRAKGKKPDKELTFEELIELIKGRDWANRDPATKAYLDEVRKPEGLAKDEVDEYAGDLDLYDKIIRLLETQETGLMIGPLLMRPAVGAEEEVIIHQNPDAPPRIRVIDGADKIEPPTISRSGGSRNGWGYYRLKVKGKAVGRAVIEIICGDKREVVRVSVR